MNADRGPLGTDEWIWKFKWRVTATFLDFMRKWDSRTSDFTSAWAGDEERIRRGIEEGRRKDKGWRNNGRKWESWSFEDLAMNWLISATINRTVAGHCRCQLFSKISIRTTLITGRQEIISNSVLLVVPITGSITVRR